jgi:enamine deaminase RidA (YjgF/YER057c/UK114 family)
LRKSSRHDGGSSATTTPENLHPQGWADPSGYAHGIAASGRIVVTAGQIGWDPATGAFATDDFVGQATQALRNVVAVLAAGGAEPQHLVRLTWYITTRSEYLAARRGLGAAYREVVGRHYPAMAVVFVAALVEERAKVEIEATAVIPA